jgi:fatty-acyl-CoA synthase
MDAKWGETGKAFVVPQKGKTITLEQIHQFLEGKAARYKWPRHLDIINIIPMTPTGKIKKADLKK